MDGSKNAFRQHDGEVKRVQFSSGRKGPEVSNIYGLKGFPVKGFRPRVGDSLQVRLELNKHGGSYWLHPVA